MEENTADNTPSTLTASLVSDADRLSFGLQHFGDIPQWLHLESPIFSWLNLLCKDYHGDYWEFYTLSNGGAFIIPSPKASTFSLTPSTAIAQRWGMRPPASLPA
ncbi:antirestriction protein [Serratia marcescens]|uniref:antirestriction protein n=1 Tax=Serratia marcescens TaxID=615 RepID=UPI00374F9C0D